MYLKFTFFAFLLILISACSGPRYANKDRHKRSNLDVALHLVHFEKSQTLSSVIEKANQRNKPIFLEFYTTWCAPCKLMEKNVFTNKETADFLNKNFINYQVNAEKANGPDLAFIYEVRSFPTLLFLNDAGHVLLRHEGTASPQTLKDIGQMALENYRTITMNR